jgi:hypothetical protein
MAPSVRGGLHEGDHQVGGLRVPGRRRALRARACGQGEPKCNGFARTILEVPNRDSPFRHVPSSAAARRRLTCHAALPFRFTRRLRL